MLDRIGTSTAADLVGGRAQAGRAARTGRPWKATMLAPCPLGSTLARRGRSGPRARGARPAPRSRRPGLARRYVRERVVEGVERVGGLDGRLETVAGPRVEDPNGDATRALVPEKRDVQAGGGAV